MTKILLINGPPRSGKDTAGDMVANLTGATVYKFATALKHGAHALFYGMHGDLSPTTCAHAMHAAAFEQDKDKPLERFFGLTPREAYIALSEVFCKPLFGTAFFGTVLAAQIAADAPALAVITDSGFVPEAEELCTQFGRENVAVLQLYRRGHHFSEASDEDFRQKIAAAILSGVGLKEALRSVTDSRNYVDLDDVYTEQIFNNGTKRNLHVLLEYNLLPEIGWK